MSEPVQETMRVGAPAPDPQRQRRLVGGVIAATLVLAGAALVSSQPGWFDKNAKTDVPSVIDHPVPSNPRALTAAVLAHIPQGVTVVWSSGSGGLTQGTPGIGPAVTLRRSLTSSVLLKVGRSEFSLSVVTGPSNQEMVPDSPGHGLVTRDKQGHPVTVVVAGSAKGTPTLITESASPTARVDLPLSDADLHAILADPLVGLQTDAATLAKAHTLPGYTESPPPLTWKSEMPRERFPKPQSRGR